MSLESPTGEREQSNEANKWSLESTPEKAMEVADAVEARLGELGWTEEQLENFKLAIHEAIVNAAMHGNEGDPTKKVTVELNMTKDENGEEMAEVTILDEGKGFDPKQIADPTEEAGLMKSDGRGIRLIKEVTDTEPEFFPGEGKVILRRNKNHKPETDSDTD
jgi:serine/threonine-protein kinase RsbW